MSRSAKFLLGFFVYSSTIFVLAFAGSFWWLTNEFMKPGPLAEEKLVEIHPGSSLHSIANTLHNESVIDNPLIFKIGALVLGAQRDLQAGEYAFTPGISTKQAMRKLERGDTVERRFTIREGLTSYEIVNLIKGVEELQGEITDIPAEGSLLPNTYDYKRGETRGRVVERLEKAMSDTIDELWETRVEGLPFQTKEEALTLASIVEKETGVPEERKRVAGVFINRLRQGIALQTDPTVIYAITKGKHKNEGKGPLGRRLLSKDLEFDSPYNTYKYPGLPPGPIANPGRASIEAVLNPEEHEFIYFVADGTGGHIFAKTLAEHNKNVAEWRKIRKEKKN